MEVEKPSWVGRQPLGCAILCFSAACVSSCGYWVLERYCVNTEFELTNKEARGIKRASPVNWAFLVERQAF